MNSYTLEPVGFIRSTVKGREDAPKQGPEGAPDASLEIEPRFADALLGMEVGNELIVITWLHEAKRDVLKGASAQRSESSAHRCQSGSDFYSRSPARPNPLDPRAGAIAAGRLLLSEIRKSISRSETLALETTLSGKTYVRIFERAVSFGYELELHYLWLSNVEQAIARVRRRVRMGGHDVPTADIRRRFKRSLRHLVGNYLPLATRWVIWDNRGLPAKRLAISATDDINLVRQLIGL
jgi:predicted ABC-type ATPase